MDEATKYFVFTKAESTHRHDYLLHRFTAVRAVAGALQLLLDTQTKKEGGKIVYYVKKKIEQKKKKKKQKRNRRRKSNSHRPEDL